MIRSLTIHRPLLAATLASLPALLAAAPAEPAPAFAWPFASPIYNVTAGYDLDRDSGERADWTGWRHNEATAGSGHAYDNHGGHDFGMATGTGIRAPARGRVVAIREVVPNNDHSDTGNYMRIDHTAATGTSVSGRDYRTQYWHLSQNGVIPLVDDNVNKGDLIAYSDNTGNSTGPHLHFEIFRSGGSQTCAFYHGWWENDEFYTANGRPCLVYLQVGSSALNVREGVGTGYNVLTVLNPNSQVVATQHNDWWRVFIPMPPPIAKEARNLTGGLATGYTEGGTWFNHPSKSVPSYYDPDANIVTLAGVGSRTSTFTTTGNPADVATYSFTGPRQRGIYDVYTTWPSDANALGVTYRITHAGGTTDVKVDQRGDFTTSHGDGTKTNPYIISQNPYIVDHTTVDAPDEWLTYSPAGSGLPENGPENLYKFTLHKATTVKIKVDHPGYPTKDIDIQLLSAPSPSSCIARADINLSSNLAAGTYYIACDSYGSGTAGNNAASPYRLTVEFTEDQPFPNSWVKLGQFNYNYAGPVTIQVREETVTGPATPGQPGRVVADAIRLVPRITRRSGWVSNDFVSRINTATNPVACVVIKTDTTPNNDSNSMDAYSEVPIFREAGVGTSNSSPVVAKAVTGQRFVCVAYSGDWYQVYLTSASEEEKGWILGDHLIGYHLDLATRVEGWELY